MSNIRPAFTTTVYAFLNPKLPSAAWDFFCLRFGFFLFADDSVRRIACVRLCRAERLGARRSARDRRAGRYARISQVEVLLLVLMVIAATGMAHGPSFV
ncbi:hypothetical protein [Pseudomonas granadensis]|uniref:hypothetical protein n=1 Tax=Pseudomonas granadensis TaxID=1421430 RepID=UPI001F155F7F|nr:hypothetical protein [Pseudomonas granadensis]